MDLVIPDEILLLILVKLDIHTLFNMVSVCQKFSRLIFDNQIWKNKQIRITGSWLSAQRGYPRKSFYFNNLHVSSKKMDKFLEMVCTNVASMRSLCVVDEDELYEKIKTVVSQKEIVIDNLEHYKYST